MKPVGIWNTNEKGLGVERIVVLRKRKRGHKSYYKGVKIKKRKGETNIQAGRHRGRQIYRQAEESIIV